VDNPDFTAEHKDKRYKAKVLNFSLNYGASAFSLRHTLGGISEKEAQKFIDTYYGVFNQLSTYFNKQFRLAKARGYILMDKVTMRRYWFTMDNDEKLKKLAKNYPIQGTSGSITKYASVLMRKWIIDNHLDNEVFITNIIHDEINVESEHPMSKLTATALEKCMSDAGKLWCTIVPLKASAVVSDHWMH